MRSRILLCLLTGLAGTAGAQVLSNTGGTLFVANGGTLFVQGGLRNGSGSQLVNRGNVVVTGDLVNEQANMADETGTFTFSGTAAQAISGAAPFVFRNVRLQNSAGITLSTALKVSGEMSFESGLVTAASAAAPLIFLAGAGISPLAPAINGSHVNGYVTKEGTGAFVFPVGDGVRYQPVGLDLATNTDGVTARYLKEDAGTAAFTGVTPLIAYNTLEYWDIKPAGTATGAVTLFWDDYGNTSITNPADLRVAHQTAGSWLNEGASATSGDATAGSVTSAPVSTWSPFAIGSVSSSSPLPVTLVSFQAHRDESQVELTWKTASETRFSHFVIQRSTDAGTFEAIGTIAGKGGESAMTSYLFHDTRPAPGTNYYRLRLVDQDGSVASSRTVAVGELSSEIRVYPNPFTGSLSVRIPGAADQTADISLVRSSGAVVYETTAMSVNRLITFHPETSLPAGLYLVRIRLASGVVTCKVVKN